MMRGIILSKEIEGYPDYVIYSDGTIFSKKLNRPLRCDHGEGFYKTFRLNNNGKIKTFKLHRLLAQAFIPNPKNKKEVNHIDGNKLNNNLSNLEWVTHEENMNHAWGLGLLYISSCNIEAASKAKFKPVINIENGIYYESIKEAAKTIGMTQRNLSRKLSGDRRNNTYFKLA